MSSDQGIHETITSLVDEEKSLRSRLSAGEISKTEEHDRLAAIEVQLDQCWDLLRQRDALRDFGGDASEAHVRPADVVEHYEG